MVYHCDLRAMALLDFRGYVDIANDIARDTSKLLAEEVAAASGDSADVPPWVNFPTHHQPLFTSQITLGVWVSTRLLK